MTDPTDAAAQADWTEDPGKVEHAVRSMWKEFGGPDDKLEVLIGPKTVALLATDALGVRHPTYVGRFELGDHWLLDVQTRGLLQACGYGPADKPVK